MKKPAHDWSSFRAAERPVGSFSRHGRYRLGLAYANSYHVGMSSLGFQRVYELVQERPDWSCERLFADGAGMPLSVEEDRPLSEFGCLAFSVSFEQDYVNLLQMLDRAGIPLRRSERGPWHPLIVMGGSCASINPLPMAEFVDVFAIGAAENVLPPLLLALEKEESRDAVLDCLASQDGFYVPAYHRPEEEGEALGKLNKLELSEEQMKRPGHLPTTAIVTPHTEFAQKFLIEMSRGCPEKCRYCWATFGMGRFRWHPTEYILASLDRARAVTDQLGFVATAVGDHPEIEKILREANTLGFRTSVSSIRIPAVTEGVLDALHASGDRSITLAPETGTDALRAKMGKPISNEQLLQKVRLIFRHGFTQLKLYFLIGLPDETMDDVQGILELAARARSVMLEECTKSGVIGHIHLGTNVLVPKPYTPWQRQPMDDAASLKAKISVLKRGVSRMPNTSLGSISVRQAIWQTYISKAGSDAASALEHAARGEHLSSLLRRFEDRIRPEVFQHLEGDLRWHFMRQA
ncbi:MAG: B12-binding domain-containing radical SAM protein [Acidobacteriota bacterium]|nr:B12-binding domain-containing radical SAM protein [Acidobacteriota bacterium]